MGEQVKVERIEQSDANKPRVEVNWKRLLPFAGLFLLIGGMVLWPFARKEKMHDSSNGDASDSVGTEREPGAAGS